MSDMRSIEDRVNEGAAWLDAVEPDWWRRVDTRTLNMSQTCHCVLGQVYGNFYRAVDRYDLYGKKGWIAAPDSPAVLMGFHHDDRAHRNSILVARQYDQLNVAWTELIEKRRANDPAVCCAPSTDAS